MKLVTTLFCLLISFSLIGQNALKPVELSLEDIVALAQNQPSEELKQRISLAILAPDALIAKTKLKNNFWQFQAFQSQYKPQISLSSTLPSFNRSFNEVRLPDGTLDFPATSSLLSSVDLSLSQVISKTGGSVSLSTGLRRIDFFQPTPDLLYLSSPISISFNQPLFAFNSLEWDKIIEPMRYNEARRAYNEDMEGIASEAVNLFFDLFIAQLSLEAAEKDKDNADTLYRISQGRFSVGKIAETELLQIEISTMNADADLARATLDLQTSTENLRNFLGVSEAVQFALASPSDIPDFQIDPQKALSEAKANRSQILAFERRLKQAERDVDRAVKSNGIEVSIVGSLGYSQRSDSLTTAYADLLRQERLAVRLSVPIMDWGRAEAERKIAESNRDLIQMNVEQDRISFERDIQLKVLQFDLVRTQTRLAEKNFEVSQKTYDLTRKRYLIGKIGVIDLNIALADLVRSRTSYMSALRQFWTAYYEIRRLTLYDFMNEKSLNKND